jgi:hypothetical protein
MKSLYDAATVSEVKQRIAHLGPESERLWGRMTTGQMLAHCSLTVEMALGDKKPSRLLLGRVLGPLVRSKFSNDEPLGKNGPTDKRLIVKEERELEAERERLCGLLDRFAAGGAEGCTTHPHVFFGKLTAEEWGKGMYKHLDHHLRQFGV